jgi:hypothetical protein
MKKILVLGGGGFIGSHLVKKFKKEGHWVRVVDLKRPEFAPSPADDFIVGDLRNQLVCDNAFNIKFDEVYQLAADMGGAEAPAEESDPKKDFQEAVGKLGQTINDLQDKEQFDEKDIKNAMNSLISAIGPEGFKTIGDKAVESFYKKMQGSQINEPDTEEAPVEEPAVEEPSTEKLDENLLRQLKSESKKILKEQLQKELLKRKKNILIENIKRKLV